MAVICTQPNSGTCFSTGIQVDLDQYLYISKSQKYILYLLHNDSGVKSYQIGCKRKQLDIRFITSSNGVALVEVVLDPIRS